MRNDYVDWAPADLPMGRGFSASAVAADDILVADLRGYALAIMSAQSSWTIVYNFFYDHQIILCRHSHRGLFTRAARRDHCYRDNGQCAQQRSLCGRHTSQ